jgi:hypothetical protein
VYRTDVAWNLILNPFGKKQEICTYPSLTTRCCCSTANEKEKRYYQGLHGRSSTKQRTRGPPRKRRPVGRAWPVMLVRTRPSPSFSLFFVFNLLFSGHILATTAKRCLGQLHPSQSCLLQKLSGLYPLACILIFSVAGRSYLFMRPLRTSTVVSYGTKQDVQQEAQAISTIVSFQ